MTTQSQAIRRSPRVRPPCPTPAVLRSKDGDRCKGELQVFSLTGGLLGLPAPLAFRSHVKVRFVTGAGAIRSRVEMLMPVSSDLQPFRFVALAGGNQRRLKTAIQLYLAQNRLEGDLIDAQGGERDHGTFFGDLFGYDEDGDDILGTNRDPAQNCPICGVAGHNHTESMTRDCAAKLISGDDQTGKATAPMPKPGSRFVGKEGRQK